MEPSSLFVQHTKIQCFLEAISITLTTSSHVEKADTGRKTRMSRPARNLFSMTINRSPTVPSSSSSQSFGNLTANCSTLDSSGTGKLAAMDSNENNTSDTQVWHTDTDPNSSTGKLTSCEIEKDYRWPASVLDCTVTNFGTHVQLVLALSDCADLDTCFSFFFWEGARRDVGGEAKSCRPPLASRTCPC